MSSRMTISFPNAGLQFEGKAWRLKSDRCWVSFQYLSFSRLVTAATTAAAASSNSWHFILQNDLGVPSGSWQSNILSKNLIWLLTIGWCLAEWLSRFPTQGCSLKGRHEGWKVIVVGFPSNIYLFLVWLQQPPPQQQQARILAFMLTLHTSKSRSIRVLDGCCS